MSRELLMWDAIHDILDCIALDKNEAIIEITRHWENKDHGTFDELKIFEIDKAGLRTIRYLYSQKLGDVITTEDGYVKPLDMFWKQLLQLWPQIQACYQRKPTWDSVPKADKQMMNHLYPTSRFQ
jgi:hypothetical protein